MRSIPVRIVSRAVAPFALALTAVAHEVTVCHSSSIPLQLTSWSHSVTVPQWNPSKGELHSVTVTLHGHIEGSAGVENLSPSSPSDATSNFAGMLAVHRPDFTILVSSAPTASFTDALSIFDGTIDFAGPSGETHAGISVDTNDSATALHPSPDAALFIGTGTITLPVTADGSSTASGGGNLVSQFMQSASTVVDVCYVYEPNEPPEFDPPCGETLMASVGVPFTVVICATDVEPEGDTITLDSGPLPPGVVLTPALPITGPSPACTTLTWTPGAGDVGTHVITFTVVDSFGEQTDCSITVVIAECYQLVGRGSGNATIVLGGHVFQTQMAGVRLAFPVTMESHPAFRVPQLSTGSLSFSIETVMHNPPVFPTNPDQWSQHMRVTIQPGGQVTSELLGTLNGIHQQVSTFVDPAGTQLMTFPFTIDGM